MKTFGTIVGWLFNIIMICGILLIMTDITGSRKSSNTKSEAPTSVQNVR